jgi:hypothetical protein
MPKAARGARSLSLKPVDLQTFASGADRKRLSPVAIKAFLKLADEWRLVNDEAASLLGVSASSYDRLKRGAQPELNQDQLTRISALVGVYKGLQLLFADEASDRWVRLANTGPLFGGKTPVEAMISGGIPTMLDVRRYVDAVRGGL